ALRHDHLHDQQPARRRNHPANVAEYLKRTLVGPVVNDMAHQVRVSASRHGFEKIAADELTSLCDAGGLDVGTHTFDHVGQVEKQSSKRRKSFQSRDQGAAVATTHVSKCPDSGEIVRIQHRFSLALMETVHRGIEKLRVLWVLAHILKQTFSKGEL